jgi:outer membrane protein assembly factor BamB
MRRILTTPHGATRVTRGAVGLIVLLAGAAPRAGAAILYAPPDSAGDVAAEIRLLEREVSDGNGPAAARRLGTLLAANRGDALAEIAPGTLCTIAAWLDGLSPEARAALSAAVRAEHEAAASRAMEGLTAGAPASPEELHALARRYPLTAAAGGALLLAGDRSMELGDFPGALALYQSALRDGAVADDVHTRRLELLKRLSAGEFLPRPSDLPGEQSPAVTDSKGVLFNAMPFDAPWYRTGSPPAAATIFPAASGDRFVIASWRSVALVRETGEVVWTANNPNPPSSFSVGRTPTGRGVAFGASVLPDVHGRPAIVVVRQPSGGGGERQFALRAFRGSDGKLLWASELATEGQRQDLTHAGLPLVCGRYVYGVAVSRTDRSTATLVLAATDVTTGGVIWQTPLGSIVEQSLDERGGKKNIVNQPLDLSSLADMTEPAVVGDLVVVSPGCGAVIAVGRFDGKVRWVHTYRAPEPPPQEELKVRDRQERDRLARQREARDRLARDNEKSALLRYRSTPAACEKGIVAFAHDSAAMLGLDRATGKRLWQHERPDGFALAGAVASENVAVVSGTTVAGLDALTGQPKWKYAPPPGAQITGPAVVAGTMVLIPVTTGVVQLDGVSGEPTDVYRVPDLRRALATDSGQSILRAIGVERAPGTR